MYLNNSYPSLINSIIRLTSTWDVFKLPLGTSPLKAFHRLTSTWDVFKFTYSNSHCFPCFWLTSTWDVFKFGVGEAGDEAVVD